MASFLMPFWLRKRDLSSSGLVLVFPSIISCEVRIFWHWIDFLAQQCCAFGQQPCFINLDETSILRCSARPLGFLAPRRFWPGRVAPRRPVVKQRRRAAVTHVTLISNLPHVQAKLPQVFLCNGYVVPARALSSPHLDKPPGVEFWRARSGWNTVDNMLRILERMHEVMGQFEGLQPIIVLDCANCHIHPRVAAAADRLGLWLVVAPAKLTFLIQPLDVYAFSPYKACLAKLFAEAEDNEGKLEAVPWLQCLCIAVRKFWRGRKWAAAFEKTGVVRGEGAPDRLDSRVATFEHRASLDISLSTAATRRYCCHFPSRVVMFHMFHYSGDLPT